MVRRRAGTVRELGSAAWTTTVQVRTVVGRNVGQRNRAALAETWGALAEVCHELSDTEWALPTECPGWDVKDQLSHLIGIEQAIMGEPAPEWDGPLGDAREERLRGDQRALRGRAARRCPGRRSGPSSSSVTDDPAGPARRR